MDAEDLGQPKAEAVAARLRRLVWGTVAAPDGRVAPRIRAVTAPVTEEAGRTACLRADVLICCADNDAARLATALITTPLHKVLVDIGTGIHHTAAPAAHPIGQGGGAGRIGARTMGADVRLIVPGMGCLLCWGGLARLARAVDDLTHPGGRRRAPVPWHEQRAGSLRSLNQIAAHLALRQIEDLVAGRLDGSHWTRIEIDPRGVPRIDRPAPAPAPAEGPCALCARAGRGED